MGVGIEGKTIDGAIALFKRLEKCVISEMPLFDARFLSGLKKNQLSEILKGNGEILMLKERLKILKKLGKVLLERFDGDFVNF